MSQVRTWRGDLKRLHRIARAGRLGEVAAAERVPESRLQEHLVAAEVHREYERQIEALLESAPAYGAIREIKRKDLPSDAAPPLH